MDFLHVDMQEKFVAISLRNYIEANDDICCCPTAGCSFAFFKTYRPGRFKCSLCKNVYCMSCKTDWHQGLSCEQYQKTHVNQRKQEELPKFKQCPTCQQTTYKTSQSEVLKCDCGTKFCYLCGEIQDSLDCNCHQRKDCASPIVQPELFHKALESPLEFKTYINSKNSLGLQDTPGSAPVKGLFPFYNKTHQYQPSASQEIVSS